MISPACEVVAKSWTSAEGEFAYIFCAKPTTNAYPAMGGGYMALCAEHAQRFPEAELVEAWAAKGVPIETAARAAEE